MKEDLENAKIAIKEEMKQEFINMLAQQKEGTINQSTPQNNDSIHIAPTIQEDDEAGEHANEEEDALQQTQPGSVVTVQKDAAPPTRSSKNSTIVSRNLFNENTANVAAPKTYITQQELMNRTRYPKRKKLVDKV